MTVHKAGSLRQARNTVIVFKLAAGNLSKWAGHDGIRRIRSNTLKVDEIHTHYFVKVKAYECLVAGIAPSITPLCRDMEL